MIPSLSENLLISPTTKNELACLATTLESVSVRVELPLFSQCTSHCLSLVVLASDIARRSYDEKSYLIN